jgi:hypothetical protein|tara:strand:- start:309 stop:476 length:168 start_codon:yes stop_codon:yes gene_type:complete
VGKILDTALPLVPEEYSFDMMVRLVSTLEAALTKTDLPAIISGEDETNGINWFMD